MKIRYFPASDVILTHKVSNKTDSILRYLLSSEKAIPRDRKTSGGGE